MLECAREPEQDDLQDGDTRMFTGPITGTAEQRGSRTGARMTQDGSEEQSPDQLADLHDRPAVSEHTKHRIIDSDVERRSREII